VVGQKPAFFLMGRQKIIFFKEGRQYIAYLYVQSNFCWLELPATGIKIKIFTN
jgi:hypothetical protein